MWPSSRRLLRLVINTPLNSDINIRKNVLKRRFITVIYHIPSTEGETQVLLSMVLFVSEIFSTKYDKDLFENSERTERGFGFGFWGLFCTR